MEEFHPCDNIGDLQNLSVYENILEVYIIEREAE